MATKTKQEVAPVEESANALAADYMSELLADSGQGLQGMDANDISISYLYILQALSPQCIEGGQAYIEGARPGMWYNNVTGEIYEGRDRGLDFISCFYERKFVEWVDRDKGGGWVGDHTTDSDILTFTKPDENKRLRLANGNLIVETAYHYVFARQPAQGDKPAGKWFQAIVPLKSSGLKANRKWNKLLMETTIPGTDKIAPRWLFPYHFLNSLETKGNNTYWVPNLDRVIQPIDIDLYKKCKKFNELVSQGKIERAPERNPDDGSAGAPSGGAEAEDIPF